MENPDKVHNCEVYILQNFLGMYMLRFAGVTYRGRVFPLYIINSLCYTTETQWYRSSRAPEKGVSCTHVNKNVKQP